MFFDNFADLSDMCREFEIDPGLLDGAEVLFACYSPGDYCGDAFVLLRRGAGLFEVNGSDCSCYGLEGQWTEEATTADALRMRPFSAMDGEARTVLETLIGWL